MTQNNNPNQLRVSPSGALVGNPPAQLGGGNFQPGNFWCFPGNGGPTNVSGSGTFATVTGLGACEVTIRDFNTGYLYDLEVTGNTYGAGTAGGCKVKVLGSHDGGANYPDTLAESATYYNGSGAILLRLLISGAPGVTYDHAKVQLTKSNVTSADLVYYDADVQLTVVELSPV